MEGRNSSETLLVFAGTLKHVVVCGAGYVCMHRTPNCTYTTIMQSHSHWQAHPFPLACAHMHAVTLTLADTPIHIGTRPHACRHTHTYTVSIYLHTYRDTSIEYTSHTILGPILVYTVRTHMYMYLFVDWYMYLLPAMPNNYV